MNDAPDAPPPEGPKPWLLWALSTLAMFGIATGLRTLIENLSTVFKHYGMTRLPRLTEGVLDVGPYLWIVAAAVALEGFRRIRKEGRAGALSWCLGALLAYLVMVAVIGWSLYSPFVLIQETLINR